MTEDEKMKLLTKVVQASNDIQEGNPYRYSMNEDDVKALIVLVAEQIMQANESMEA